MNKIKCTFPFKIKYFSFLSPDEILRLYFEAYFRFCETTLKGQTATSDAKVK